MSLEITKRSGFVLRVISLQAFSCMAVFAAIVVVSNPGIEEVFPSSLSRSLALMFGYIVAIMSFNYALAVRGRNFMGWKVEANLIAGVVMVFVGFFLPFAFPDSVIKDSEGFFSFFGRGEELSEPNWIYVLTSLFSLPFLYMAFLHLKKMPLWRHS